MQLGRHDQILGLSATDIRSVTAFLALQVLWAEAAREVRRRAEGAEALHQLRLRSLARLWR